MTAPRLPVYSATLRSRKDLEAQRDREGYTDAWGWWADVCPGKTLYVRKALASDLERCSLREGSSLNPDDWVCELGERGSLISRAALTQLNPI